MAQQKFDFPISTASVSWMDAGGTSHIRVYSSDGYNVTEQIWDGTGWNAGSFNAPGSQVSATAWVNGGVGYVRVYCTGDDKTVEWCADAGADSYYQGSYPSPS